MGRMTGDLNQLAAKVEETIRGSEVQAVANLIRAGGSVRLGQVIDYRIDSPAQPETLARNRTCSKPYRVTVEQWHLDAAEALLRSARSDLSQTP